MEELISIIIPVYNVEKYLTQCLESVVNQTYRNIEIILINDGSTDNSIEICENFAKVDNRIRLLNRKNAGVSAARNIGLSESNGKYIAFIDSDDYVSKEYIQFLYDSCKDSKADMSICGVFDIKDGKVIRESKKLKKLANGEETLKELLDEKHFNCVIWGKLYRKDIIINHRFNENIKVAEDLELLYKLLPKLSKVCIDTEKRYYYYRVREGSTITQEFNENHLGEVKISESIINFTEKKLPQLRSYAIKRYVVINMRYIMKIIKQKKYNEEILKELINNIIKYDKGDYYKMLSIKEKFKFWAITNKLDLLKKKYNITKQNLENKVGIITIIDNNNYGNRLQNYALQESLKKLKFTVETIKNIPLFNNELTKSNKIINNIKYIKGILIENIKAHKIRKKCFEDFNIHIDITSKQFRQDKEYNEYNYFVIGSDQVWNPTFERLSDFDLGNFNTTAKKISYAASFGISELPEKYMDKTKKALDAINNISVREYAGKCIIEKLTNRKDIQVLIDPTMLLTADEWDKVAKRPTQLEKEKKYILNYFLGELSLNRKKEIERIAKENNCEIINILDKNSPFYQTGPSEFLYLEKNAFIICTDSFHSCVFAMLYNRPFIIFDREDNTVSMNSRIDTLLSKFNLRDRKFNQIITEKNINHDYTEAYEILKEEREKSIKFLESALDIQ